MKKEYNSLEIELFFLENGDVVTASKDDLISDDTFDD